MAENSKIEWTDHTFNPWVGCQVASPDGCANCYAADWAKRYGRDFAQRTRTSDANWKQPLKWNARAQAEGRRYRVFCASLADVFDNEVPAEWRADLFTLIAKTPNLDWLLLTKRIGNVQKMLSDIVHSHDEGLSVLDMMEPDGGWYRNVWIGATVVNQAEADRDVPKLLRVPAAVRFLSVEPMLGPISLRCIDVDGDHEIHPLTGTTECVDGEGQPAPDLPGISWVICGGESGPKARPMHPDWARSLRDQCAAAGVPFLWKQWGEWVEADRDGDIVTATEASGIAVEERRYDLTAAHGAEFIRVGKKAAGRLLDGRTHDEFPRA